MTCIVGMTEGGKVYIGGDSSRVSDGRMTIRPGYKVFHKGGFLFGCAGSIRAEQLWRYSFKPPDRDPRLDTDAFMATAFIDAARECLKDGGSMATFKTGEDKAAESAFLVGYEGKLYEADDDFQIVRLEDSFAAVGCGASVALGAMYMAEVLEMKAEDRIRRALAAAERYHPGVRGPFTVESV